MSKLLKCPDCNDMPKRDRRGVTHCWFYECKCGLCSGSWKRIHDARRSWNVVVYKRKIEKRHE